MRIFRRKNQKYPLFKAVFSTAVMSAAVLAAVLSFCFFSAFTAFADTPVSDTPSISDVPAISGQVPETKASQGSAPVIGNDPVISGGSGSTDEKHAQEIGGGSKSGSGSSTGTGSSTGSGKNSTIISDTAKNKTGQDSNAVEQNKNGTAAGTSSGTNTGTAAGTKTDTNKDSTQISDAPKTSGSASGGEITSAPMAASTVTGTSAPAAAAQTGTQATAQTGSQTGIQISAPTQNGQAENQGSVSIAGPSSGKSNSSAAGSNHANDAVSRISLDFSLITPTHSKGVMNVARGQVQLNDGTWQEIGYKDNIHYAFYKLKTTKTDSSGTWYVASVKARRFGDATADDGELKTELWLNASDCIVRSTIDVNTTSSTRIAIVKAALAMLGKQYVYGGNGPDSYDCSGLAKAVYKEAGITVPRTSSQMLQLDGEISAADLRPGDLMVRSGHCGIYIGNGIFVHASDSSVGVVAEYLSVYNLSNKFTNYFNVVGD